MYIYIYIYNSDVGIDTFCSSLSGDLIYLAEDICRPAAENVLGHKKFIGTRRQATGGGVRMAGGGPNLYNS